MEPWIKYIICAIFILLCIDVAQNWRESDSKLVGGGGAVFPAPDIKVDKDGGISIISGGKASKFIKCFSPHELDPDRSNSDQLCSKYKIELKSLDQTIFVVEHLMKKGSAWCFRYVRRNGEEYEQERHYDNRDDCPAGWAPQ